MTVMTHEELSISEFKEKLYQSLSSSSLSQKLKVCYISPPKAYFVIQNPVTHHLLLKGPIASSNSARNSSSF
jgi:hypothetical protein